MEVHSYRNGKLEELVDLSPVEKLISYFEKSLMLEYNESVLNDKFTPKKHDTAYLTEKVKSMDKRQLGYTTNDLVSEIIKHSRGAMYLLAGKQRQYKVAEPVLSKEESVKSFESKLEKELNEVYKECLTKGEAVLGDYSTWIYLEKAQKMNKEQLGDLILNYLVPKIIEISKEEIELLFDSRYENKHKTELKRYFELWKKIYLSPEAEEYRKMKIGRVDNPIREESGESDSENDYL